MLNGIYVKCSNCCPYDFRINDASLQIPEQKIDYVLTKQFTLNMNLQDGPLGVVWMDLSTPFNCQLYD